MIVVGAVCPNQKQIAEEQAHVILGQKVTGNVTRHDVQAVADLLSRRLIVHARGKGEVDKAEILARVTVGATVAARDFYDVNHRRRWRFDIAAVGVEFMLGRSRQAARRGRVLGCDDSPQRDGEYCGSKEQSRKIHGAIIATVRRPTTATLDPARPRRVRLRCSLRFGPRLALQLAAATAFAAGCSSDAPLRGDDFRVYPYLQNPAPEAMTVMWFARAAGSCRLGFRPSDRPAAEFVWLTSDGIRADALAYDRTDRPACRRGTGCNAPYRHRVRVRGLRPDTSYDYVVEQSQTRFQSQFRTGPGAETRRPLRLIMYADCETEPESTGVRVSWSDPSGRDLDRRYLIDQTRGYANNLSVIRSRRPDLIAIAGDLVEVGGQQQDWDEFWRHLTRADGRASLASQTPVMASPGNHEYYAGPAQGHYAQPNSERAIDRFLTYFEFPQARSANSASAERGDGGRYYRLDYGPVALIALDVVNDSPHQSAHDSNFYLRGPWDERGGRAPPFGPGSRQYQWLHEQLRDTQARAQFTVVLLHHAPYSVGPHGWPPGKPLPGMSQSAARADLQSGVPVRRLTPLFMQYGVDLVVAGHDEMWEHSRIADHETLPDGSRRAHVIHFYDVGIGGDGLRAPQPGLANPHQVFLAHKDAPEVWRDGELVRGGKHYGHLEVDLTPESDGSWRVVLSPVYVLPRRDKKGQYTSYERHLYDDSLTLQTPRSGQIAPSQDATPSRSLQLGTEVLESTQEAVRSATKEN